MRGAATGMMPYAVTVFLLIYDGMNMSYALSQAIRLQSCSLTGDQRRPHHPEIESYQMCL